MQAWKIVIPTSNVAPEPRAHDGYEWIYVLSGQMRLVLGDQDWVLGPGDKIGCAGERRPENGSPDA